MMAPKSNRPAHPVQLISPAWPLQRWGIDLVDPLPTAQGNYKYVVVAVEYFKVDRGETTSEYHIRSCQKILLAKHNLQVWSTKRANS